MNGVECIVDTNILIHLQNNVPQIVGFIDGKIVFISFVSELEILSKHGLTAKQEKEAQSMIDDCIVIDMNEKIKKQAIAIRKKYQVKLPDAIIAATAISYELPLITCDKGFKNIPELDLILLDI